MATTPQTSLALAAHSDLPVHFPSKTAKLELQREDAHFVVSICLLLHHQEEGAAVPNSGGVQGGRQDVWIVHRGARQQRDLRCESPDHPDDVGVRFQPLLPKEDLPGWRQQSQRSQHERWLIFSGQVAKLDTPFSSLSLCLETLLHQN